MKKLFLILFLAIGYFANAQVPTGLPTLFNGKWYKFTQYLQADSGFFNPQRDTMFIPNRAGCVVFRTADSILYIYTGSRWKGVGSGNGSGVYNAGYGLNLTSGTFKVDSSFISTKLWRQKGVDSLNSIKLNKSDTAAMLLPYLRKADTTAMLLPYLRKGDTAAMLTPYLRKGDTATLSNIYRNNGTLSSNRTIEIGNKYLNFTNAGQSVFILSRDAYNFYSTDNVGNMVARFNINGAAVYPIIEFNQSRIQVNSNVLNTNNGTDEYEYVVRNKSTNLLEKVSKNYNTVVITDTNYVVPQTVDVVFLRNATTVRTIQLPSSPTIGKQVIVSFRSSGSKYDIVSSGTVLDKSGTTITFIPINTTFTFIYDGTNWIIIWEE